MRIMKLALMLALMLLACDANANDEYAPAFAAPTASDNTASGVRYPKFKMVIGADGTQTPVSSSNPLPISGTVTAGGGAAGSYAQSNVVGTSAVTFTKPANAIGFILQASSSNSVNLRFAVGATPNTTTGIRLEPGRDSGYVPIAADVKVVAESGSNQEAQIQWVLSQ